MKYSSKGLHIASIFQATKMLHKAFTLVFRRWFHFRVEDFIFQSVSGPFCQMQPMRLEDVIIIIIFINILPAFMYSIPGHLVDAIASILYHMFVDISPYTPIKYMDLFEILWSYMCLVSIWQ